MDRFWSKVKKSDGCWDWIAHLDRKGYGAFGLHGKIRRAHVVSYQLSVGDIPSGLVLDHICRNRKCVRPDHLRPVTFKENVLCGTSFSATNASKTHCKNGHEFSAENTYTRPNGNRDCRVCVRARVEKYSKGNKK